jgi:cytoplasmic iron level regulating protein YaaA (DUF328/UPF0246 family)
MIVLISPSKSIMKQSPPKGLKLSDTLFPEKTEKLVSKLQKLNAKQLGKLLNISPELAELNYSRFQKWDKTEKRPALWMYSGDVYNGIDAYSLNDKQTEYAQEKLMIISGLYGLVRPLDEVQPYRLEMKTNTEKLITKDLYDYWKKEIATKLQLINDKNVLICASKEYSKAVLAGLSNDMTAITPRFMQETSSGLKEKGLFAKYGRGLLARWVIDNQIDNPSKLKNFNKEGFKYSSDLSSEKEAVFIIPKDFSLKGRFTKK